MQIADANQTAIARRLKRRLAILSLDQYFPGLRKTPVAASRGALWKHCVERIGVDTPVTVLDFGVYKGRSTAFWARHFKNRTARLHGFDSFEGLPSDWTPTMPKGTFSTEGQIPQIGDARVAFHPGWIQNTLPAFLESGALNGRENIVVHVDTDLYSAALFILTTIWHYVDSYYVIFDEFGIDENLAFANFVEAYPVKVEFYGHTMNAFKLPAQVFGFVTKVEYQK